MLTGVASAVPAPSSRSFSSLDPLGWPRAEAPQGCTDRHADTMGASESCHTLFADMTDAYLLKKWQGYVRHNWAAFHKGHFRVRHFGGVVAFAVLLIG